MSMVLSGLSMFIPSLASLYKGCPPIFIAEYIGGVCFIRPVKLFRTLWISVSLIKEKSVFPIILPVKSYVSVLSPSFNRTIYSLSRSDINLVIFVASFRQTISTPVAIGSSVPAWPAFLAEKSLFTFITAFCEDMFLSLLRFMTKFSMFTLNYFYQRFLCRFKTRLYLIT